MKMPKRLRPLWGLLFLLPLSFCTKESKPKVSNSLFRQVSTEESGIDFNNTITESDALNILNQANLYNGGGIGVGDFNQDGLQDVYFAGNMVSNKLYLNQGNFEFKDITDEAKVGGDGHWCTGVTVVDINTDGLPDIYVAASFREDAKLRTNLLYINKGVDGSGIPIFEEVAAAYGLADDGFSTQGYFFDYDRDGDLDLYLVTNEVYDPLTPIRYRPKRTDGSAKNTDRLYRNNGNGTFTNVSREAGIDMEGWGHAAGISDFNGDGWPDVYVANDFVSNDLLYINNQDGTFTNSLEQYFKHTAWNAMGTDVVDLNNDGYPDMISLEMLPEDNLRKKRMLSGNEYFNYENNEEYHYSHQYVRNVMQLNSGPTPVGHPVFTDRAFMSGIYQTDWSWGPLVADFDADGYKDIIITNGLPRDVTDMDYRMESGRNSGQSGFALKMTDSLPILEISNYAFKNIDGTRFTNTSHEWGLDQKSFSNGGVYVDLDNDGDLDVLVNNINGPAFVYENTKKDSTQNLVFTLKGPQNNPDGVGAMLKLYTNKGLQYYEHYPFRGYLSSNDARVHFGLGAQDKVDSLVVVWPDGKKQQLQQLPTDATLAYSSANATDPMKMRFPESTIFKNVTQQHHLEFRPTETDFIDYNIQTMLPHKLSQFGPGIAVGDIDGNGLDDFYLGGSSDNPGLFFMQRPDGTFVKDSDRFLQKEDILYEDMGVLLFDADNDGDLDLYLVSGSYEIPGQHQISNDRFFLNNGKGFFKRADAFPEDRTNGSCVKAADFDGDGDLDLFVGGRVVSEAYPMPANNFLFRNDNGIFTDVTDQYNGKLKNIGMVTDALWSDFDNDGRPDLILAGEWMPITFLRNTGTALEEVQTGLQNKTGWWNSLVAGDFDNDGDMDYVAGNLGLNTNYTASDKEPMTIIAKDMDNNGTLDAMVFCYMEGADGVRRSYPIPSRDDLIAQVGSMKKQYPTYADYGLADMDALWPESLRQGALIMQATEMRSSYIENKGNGQFAMTALSLEAQVAPVFGMMASDVDGDNHLDLLLVGNDFGMDPYSGRHDAFNGLCLQGNGKGAFNPMALQRSGFFVDQDAKALASVHLGKNKELLVATQNQGNLVVMEQEHKEGEKYIPVLPNDFTADITFKDGGHRRMELPYGHSYLSQSSRYMKVTEGMAKIEITNYKGAKRTVL